MKTRFLQKFIRVYRLIANLILVGLVLFLGFILIQVKWLGYQTYTDNEAGFFYLTARLFVFVSAFLLINSTLFFILKHWRIYRTVAVLLSAFISIVIVLPREYFIRSILGEELSTFRTASNVQNSLDFYIELRLFRDGDFLSESTDFELFVENKGTYVYDNDTLVLHFENGKSDFMQTKFMKVEDGLECIDCLAVIRLEKQSQTKQSRSINDFPDMNLKSVLEHNFD